MPLRQSLSKLSPALTALVLTTALISPVHATMIIDQDQPTDTALLANFRQNDLAQSFKQSVGNIAGAGLKLRSQLAFPESVTIALWDALPNAGGSMIASGSTVAMSGQYADVFWAPVAITPGQTYILVFSGIFLGAAGDISDPYPDGIAYANPGFDPFPNNDFTFRTYAENAYEVTIAAPEPNPLAALGLGLTIAGVTIISCKRTGCSNLTRKGA